MTMGKLGQISGLGCLKMAIKPSLVCICYNNAVKPATLKSQCCKTTGCFPASAGPLRAWWGQGWAPGAGWTPLSLLLMGQQLPLYTLFPQWWQKYRRDKKEH